MTHIEVRGQVGAYLCDQLDAFQGLIDQRDRARAIACDLEGELHHVEQERDALILELEKAQK